MKRTTSVLILIALLAASAASCGGEATSVDTTNGSEAANTPGTEDLYLDDLPADVNLGGQEIRFLYRAEVANEFYVEEATGDVVDDAIHASVTAVEERLNAKLAATLMDGHYLNARDGYKNHITNSIMAGDDLYDWVDMMSGSGPILQQNGTFKNLLKNDQLHFDKPYYVRDLVDNMAITDGLYFLCGDASLGYMKTAFCLYYNKKIAENFKVEDVYALVDSGKWTVDKAREITAATAADVNGDGSYTMADDNYGFVIHDTNHIWGFMNSTDTHTYLRSDDGTWQYNYGTEADFDNVSRIHALLYETDGNFRFTGTNASESQQEEYNQITAAFTSDRIFMLSAEMDDSVAYFRDMKTDYGILPMPKKDEAQENYYSGSRSTHNIFAMPVTTNNAEYAAMFMEALSADKYQRALPAYFEVALKTKYSRDDDSARMYDIIHDGMLLNFSYLYSPALGVGNYFTNGVAKPTAFASYIASSKDANQAKFDAYIEKMKENCLE